MKGRLITNGILSCVNLALFIFSIIALASVASKTSYDGNGTIINTSKSGLVSAGTAWLIMFLLWIPTVTMGIITLAMSKHESAIGLTIASGVLGILGGMMGVNAIVSFLGYAAIRKSESA